MMDAAICRLRALLVLGLRGSVPAFCGRCKIPLRGRCCPDVTAELAAYGLFLAVWLITAIGLFCPAFLLGLFAGSGRPCTPRQIEAVSPTKGRCAARPAWQPACVMPPPALGGFSASEAGMWWGSFCPAGRFCPLPPTRARSPAPAGVETWLLRSPLVYGHAVAVDSIGSRVGRC